MTTSARNEGLANGIAEAFIKAVLQFCESDKLQYQWMRYLPQEDGYPWDTFWTSLIHQIGVRLERTPVLRPASLGPLRLLAASRIHAAKAFDKHGKPLFADIAPERYISLKYRRQDLNLLMEHGLEVMSMSEIIERIKHDLAAPDSRMKSIVDEDWHSKTAQLLNPPFTSLSQNLQEEVKQLSMLPLRDGRWTSIKSGTTYYPRVDGIDLVIPLDLVLDVLDSTAVANNDRKQLFDSIRVQTASPSFIREAIFKKYKGSFTIKYKDAASHLRFLYLTQHLVKQPFRYEQVWLAPEQGPYLGPDQVDFYIRDESPYGACTLLEPTDSGSNPGDDAPGFDVLFLHSSYFQHTPNPQTADSLSWKDWLHEFFHVRRSLRLIDKNETKLSDICKYVAEHRPEKFIGFLQATWKAEPPSCLKEKDIIKELGELDVLCIGGEKCRLDSTYLPLKELKKLCSRFLLDDEFFPWLQLETDLTYDTFPPEWQALGKAFGLGLNQSDMTFILDVLEHLLDQNRFAEDFVRPERVYELYVYLQAEVRKSNPSDKCETVIRYVVPAFKENINIVLAIFYSNTCFREYFDSKESIFVPKSTTQEATWALPKDCVWESPIEMMTKHSLAKLYASQFQQFSADSSNLANFFGKTLEIPNCNWEDLVKEIRAFKSSGCTNFDRISALYTCLADQCRIANSADNLK